MKTELEEREDLRQAKPYLRSAIALLIYLRYGINCSTTLVDDCYKTADKFVAALERDVKEASSTTTRPVPINR